MYIERWCRQYYARCEGSRGKVRIEMPINYSVYCDDSKKVMVSEKEPT